MLRYLEQAGLVAALRTPGGHRHYGPRQIERLQKLRELIDGTAWGSPTSPSSCGCAPTRSSPGPSTMVRAAPPHRRTTRGRHLPPPGHRRRAAHRSAAPTTEGELVSITLTPDSAGSVHDFKVADLSLAAFGRKEIELAEHEMPGLMALRREFGPQPAAEGQEDRRLAAHDRADRRPHRDARRARRRRALGQLQHLLHPGPRGRGGRRRPERHAGQPAGRPGLRLEGRDAGGVLVVHRADAHLAGRLRPGLDRRRRR